MHLFSLYDSRFVSRFPTQIFFKTHSCFLWYFVSFLRLDSLIHLYFLFTYIFLLPKGNCLNIMSGIAHIIPIGLKYALYPSQNPHMHLSVSRDAVLPPLTSLSSAGAHSLVSCPCFSRTCPSGYILSRPVARMNFSKHDTPLLDSLLYIYMGKGQGEVQSAALSVQILFN